MTIALPRSTGFALARPARRLELDPTRIATLSGTLALNALALGLLMMPISMAPPQAQRASDPGLIARDVVPPRPKPQPVPVDISRMQPRPTPTAIDRRVAVPQPTKPVQASGSASDDAPTIAPAGDPLPPASAATGTDVGPEIMRPPSVQRMTLGVIDNPAPSYPRRALQQNLSGTVLLEILVGLDGAPVEVTIARSSGHRVLDEAAREQVLRRWRFQPASVGAQPVQALVRVPITFSLER